ncbi:hypothetical protein LSTR_LSTR012869 [Laodelphax striatellus]|uniref:Uncharacterized protein n=1 Tax=Laodelphax striatellus TaxID=195883 RepID=A0A482WNR7_LAOST|nr:hypothetical protein LSTR_LSTR012869 [Laodelphax striatellus]
MADAFRHQHADTAKISEDSDVEKDTASDKKKSKSPVNGDSRKTSLRNSSSSDEELASKEKENDGSERKGENADSNQSVDVGLKQRKIECAENLLESPSDDQIDG